jgi:hypothetical protein
MTTPPLNAIRQLAVRIGKPLPNERRFSPFRFLTSPFFVPRFHKLFVENGRALRYLQTLAL